MLRNKIMRIAMMGAIFLGLGFMPSSSTASRSECLDECREQLEICERMCKEHAGAAVDICLPHCKQMERECVDSCR
jgi:hypothetical protein